MKKTTICSLINVALVAVTWVGLNLFTWHVLGWSALWQILLVAILACPVSGYFVQYAASPVVNRLIGGRIDHLKEK